MDIPTDVLLYWAAQLRWIARRKISTSFLATQIADDIGAYLSRAMSAAPDALDNNTQEVSRGKECSCKEKC